MIKKLFFAAILLFGYSNYVSATWTTVQVYTPPRTQCGTPGTYTSLECDYTLPQVVAAGHPLTFHFVTQFDGQGLPQQVLTAVHACICPAPCTSLNEQETWILDPAPCQGYEPVGQGAESTDCAIVTKSNGGWQCLSFYRTNPSGLHQTMGGDFIELTTDASHYYFATASNGHGDTASTQTMTAVTLPGSGNFAVLQAISSDPSTVTNCSNLFTDAHYGYCQSLNVSSVPTPVWGISPIPYGAAGSAVVWGEGNPPAGTSIFTFGII